MDHIDKKILQELQRNGRLTIQELSETVGLSPSPVARRKALLEKKAIIKGYGAVIDEAKLGYTISIFISVKLDRQSDESIATFEKTISNLPEVVDCWLMTGNRDYLMRVATSSLDEFERFLTTSLTKIPCVASIESSIPLRRVKSSSARTI